MRLPTSFAPPRARCRQSGMSLVEIMVASALLLVISLGLTLMFNQTQRAFRAGVKQVDVLEGGREALDMIARDIERAAASQLTNQYNLAAHLPLKASTVNVSPDGTTSFRSNYLQDLYVLNWDTNQWQVAGYRVLNPNDPDNTSFIGVGTLYRFVTNHPALSNNIYANEFYQLPVSNQINEGCLRLVTDGVIHLQARLYDTNGHEFTISNNVPGQILVKNGFENQPETYFSGPALPAMVEVELAVLEPVTYAQLKPLLALTDNSQALDFIKRNSGRIQIFRKQIPIRVARQ